jgi:hypothetical protein
VIVYLDRSLAGFMGKEADVLSNKTVVVISAELPIGAALNTAALLGVGLGHHGEDLVGGDATDGSGDMHRGMCNQPIPVLRATAEHIRELRGAAVARDGVEVHDVNQVARFSRSYESYVATLGGTKEEDLEYAGLGLHGPRAVIDSLTGQLPLYR